MNTKLPAAEALQLISEAEDNLIIGRTKEAALKLNEALGMQHAIAAYRGDRHKHNRHLYTDVIARAHLVAWQLGDHALAGELYIALSQWTDHSNHVQREQFGRITRIWNRRNQNFLLQMFPGLKRPLVIIRKLLRRIGQEESYRPPLGL